MIRSDLQDLQAPQSKLNFIYRGIVEENVDPLEAGRCRVRIFGVHTATKEQTLTNGIPTNELPWAEPALSIIEGAISNYGVWGVPLQGSHVFVFFENGNPLQPRFFASAPGIPTVAPDTTVGFNDPDGVYPDKLNSPDFYKGNASSEYPECISFVTHGGHRIEIDNTPGNKRILIFHNTGTNVEVDNTGNINVTGVANEIDGITGNKTINIGSNKITTIGGTDTKTVDGAESDTIGGAWTINVTGNVTLTAPSVDIASGGTTISTGAGAQSTLMNQSTIALYNGHTHHHGDPAGETDTPTQQATSANATTNTTAS